MPMLQGRASQDRRVLRDKQGENSVNQDENVLRA